MKQNRNPNTTCTNCNTGIYRQPSTLQRYSKAFCTKDCRNQFHGFKETVVCKRKECNNTFLLGWRKQIYCSVICANKGREGITYRGGRTSNLELLQRTFDFSSCMIEGCNYSKIYEVHRHITGKEGGTYEIGNMFAICPNHHAEITRKIITIKKINDFTLKILT